jgi:hypothetical protein
LVRWFAYLLALALVATMLPLPWALIGLPASVAAGVVAIIAMVAMRRGASFGLWVAIVCGLLVSGGLALTDSVEAVFYREFQTYQQCRSDAITVAATAHCENDFRSAVNARVKGLGISIYPSASPTPTPSS